MARARLDAGAQAVAGVSASGPAQHLTQGRITCA